MNTLPALLLALGALLVLALLARHAWVLRQRVQARQAALQARADARRQQEADLRLSLQVLAQGLLDGQVDASEASLRIHTLLQGFALDCNSRHGLVAFADMAADLADQPVGAARAALPVAERQRLDRVRADLEARHRDALHAAARQLLALLRTQ